MLWRCTGLLHFFFINGNLTFSFLSFLNKKYSSCSNITLILCHSTDLSNGAGVQLVTPSVPANSTVCQPKDEFLPPSILETKECLFPDPACMKVVTFAFGNQNSLLCPQPPTLWYWKGVWSFTCSGVSSCYRNLVPHEFKLEPKHIILQ